MLGFLYITTMPKARHESRICWSQSHFGQPQSHFRQKCSGCRNLKSNNKIVWMRRYSVACELDNVCKGWRLKENTRWIPMFLPPPPSNIAREKVLRVGSRLLKGIHTHSGTHQDTSRYVGQLVSHVLRVSLDESEHWHWKIVKTVEYIYGAQVVYWPTSFKFTGN